jgi:hypothetical protein
MTRITRHSRLIFIRFSLVGSNSVFVLIVNLDLEELFHAFSGPHLDCIPSHAFADVNTDFATNALIKANLHIGNNDIEAAAQVPWGVLDAIHRAEADASLTTRAVVGYDNGDLFRFLLLARDLRRGFRDDQCWIGFFRIVCHGLMHS